MKFKLGEIVLFKRNTTYAKGIVEEDPEDGEPKIRFLKLDGSAGKLAIKVRTQHFNKIKRINQE